MSIESIKELKAFALWSFTDQFAGPLCTLSTQARVDLVKAESYQVSHFTAQSIQVALHVSEKQPKSLEKQLKSIKGNELSFEKSREEDKDFRLKDSYHPSLCRKV